MSGAALLSSLSPSRCDAEQGHLRAIADVRGHVCTLASRSGHTFMKFNLQVEEVTYNYVRIRAANALGRGVASNEVVLTAK